MLTALISDIHGNREAFEVCLAHAREAAVDRYVFLGDFVGYGADPGFVLDTVEAMVADGAIALLGNHDAAVGGSDEHMNSVARAAIAWTRDHLSAAQRGFLESLPLSHREGESLFVHANPWDPADWDYILDPDDAERAFGHVDARLIFCGHTHVPVVFRGEGAHVTGGLIPDPELAVPLAGPARWLAVVGACGQPRDRNPAACYALLDSEAETMSYVRLAYDIETAARKIQEAGLPVRLAERLFTGH